MNGWLHNNNNNITVSNNNVREMTIKVHNEEQLIEKSYTKSSQQPVYTTLYTKCYGI